MPMPSGSPMPLSAEVAGSLSRMQGQMMAAQPEVQNAYAMHWLAMREAGGMPAFQQMTQNMLWGLYGYNALSGLLRHALSGRATPTVMAGIIDQVNLIQQSYTRAASNMQEFLSQPEAQAFPMVPLMVRSFSPLDRVYQAVQRPMETVTTALTWNPGPPMAMVPIQQANLTWPGTPGEVQAGGMPPGAMPTGQMESGMHEERPGVQAERLDDEMGE
jgi:hypothetical protein